MNGKGIGLALLFILLGGALLSLNYFIVLDYSLYFILIISFILLLTGVTILNQDIIRSYRVQETGFREDYSLLKSETQFYLMELTKIASVFILGFAYPFETFFIFVFLDCLDGWWLPYKKRSLTLRHRIDKFTDLLCEVMFYLVLIRMWPELIALWSFLFIMVVLKSVAFLKTGSRNALIYLPNIFMVMFPITLGMYFYTPEFFTPIFSSIYNLITYIAIMLILSSLYEAVYNGALSHLRYRIKERWEQL
jgi:hypothetical protein